MQHEQPEQPEQVADQAAARIDEALSQTQRLEREELQAALERQRAADERVVAALAKHQSD